MPKAMTRAMKHPYARAALRHLRCELHREPTVEEIQHKSAWMEFENWLHQEVVYCITYDDMIRKRTELFAKRAT